jgi:hypothetical protein
VAVDEPSELLVRKVGLAPAQAEQGHRRRGH